jgi:hypothetical protein
VLDYDDWLARLAGHAHAGGLAGSLVWRILDPGGDSTSVLPVATVRLDLADPIYPGCPGGTSTGNLGVWTSGGGKSLPARLGDLPAATLSEILRGVDLLVSTSGFGMAAEREDRYRDAHLRHLAESPLGPMAEMRRQALERALAGRDGLAGMRFDARHLRLGPYAIHLATGRVTRDGEPVTIDLPKRSTSAVAPWLPYDEKLLEAILHTVLEIARRLES